MAITSEDINNASFSLERKGYNVDEVDDFLEHVAAEIDALNARIAELGGADEDADNDEFAFDMDDAETAEGAQDADGEESEEVKELEDELAEEEAEPETDERDARIAELEAQLKEKNANDNAIAAVMITAQRSADEIVANANTESASTIQNAQDEAKRILDAAEADRQKVMEAIQKLEDDREDAREDYKDLLNDFISDAQAKLANLANAEPKHKAARIAAAAAAVKNSEESTAEFESVGAALVDDAEGAYTDAEGQAPLTIDGAGAYTTPSVTGAMPAVAPATVTPTTQEKDFSGFGDTGTDFDLDID